MEVRSNGLGHMTKMAAMQIYVKKTFKIIFYGTKMVMTLKLDMQHLELKYYQIYPDDNPNRLTVTYFTAMSNGPFCLCMGKRLNCRLPRNWWIIWDESRYI